MVSYCDLRSRGKHNNARERCERRHKLSETKQSFYRSTSRTYEEDLQSLIRAVRELLSPGYGNSAASMDRGCARKARRPGTSCSRSSRDNPKGPRDLAQCAQQVSQGMHYIGSRGISHRDLAGRNVLVDVHGCSKVADFGLFRSIRRSETDVYHQKSKRALPVRWTAPESLYLQGVFTFKSDVCASKNRHFGLDALPRPGRSGGDPPRARRSPDDAADPLPLGAVPPDEDLLDDFLELGRFGWRRTTENRPAHR
ncbi:hypothetical protein HPB47_017612 [Ixodes persulcatus]|uniref:Uncharacterized protein n=1 Tax=Ixodes persulcatus TaxID=34615 RepID=A0AC60QPW5_IXOPE|nr:hypothetical protein HPB47_017612 [Ixodes persulcatus]